MNRLCNLGLAIAVTLGVALQPVLADGWLTSWEEALAQSRRTQKPILADFTGSDWCGWCARLKKEVFDTTEFQSWAKANVVLLELDYPRSAAQLPEIKQQNERLAEKYEVELYPTVLFLNERGEVLGRSGYLHGGPEPWIRNVKKVLQR